MSRIRPGSGTADPMLKPRPRRKPTGRNPFAEAFIQRQREKFNAAMPVTTTAKKPPTRKKRASVDPDRRQPLRPQKVERVSVMPQDMKSKDVAIPNQEVRIKRKPQQTGVGVAIPEKANQQNLAEAQRRQLQRGEVRAAVATPDTRTKQERDAALQKFLKNAPPELAAKIREQLKKQRELRAKREQRQVRQLAVLEPFKDTPELRRQREEFKRKNRIAERYIKGEIGRGELKGNFSRQEIRNIERGSVYRKYMDGKITDRQLGRSGMFSLREIRDIKRQLRIKRMSPEERRAYGERQRKERQRLDKMAEDRRTQPQRRRRRIRDAFRRMREERRSRRGLRGRTRRLEKPTTGIAPDRYRTRRQQERATGVRVPRRGRRGLI